jgi:hypothetical protein
MARGRRATIEVPVLTVARHGGADLVAVKVDQQGASLAGKYWSLGYGRFLETGDVSFLERFEDETVGGLPLLTDPDLVEDFYYRFGHVDFQEYYKP